ncbi:MAG: caspase family protein [Lewinellaceae bacterium]|nr:caspase family protein [Lewinellaceae bacterium]
MSIWHREVQVQTPSGAIGMTIGKVLPEITVLQPLAGFNVSPEENLRAFITHLPQRYINFLAEDHADNKALIRELQEDQELQEHGVRWTTVLAGLEYVLHFTQTHCYLTRAFEDTEGAPEENALNPYRPLTKPIDLSAGIWTIKEFLKQVVNWEFLKCLEAPYNEEFSQGHFEINVFQGEDGKWKAVPKDGDLFQVDMYPGERRGVDDFSNTIRIELVNRSRRNLYISAFQLTSFLGSLSLISEMEHLELKAGEKIFLPGETDGNIPIRLEHRTLAYNLPQEYLEIKILASPEPFSTFGYRMKDFPGPPGSEYFEEDGYFMEKGTNIGMIRALEGVFIAPLLNISLDNPAYNLPNSVRLEELLRRPDAAPFLRALYFDSLHLAPRYELKQQIELQAEESPGSKMAEPLPAAYVHTPNGLDILESQLQQLYPRLREKAEKPILVALGDSWFNQAQPVDIPHFLMEDFMVIHAPLGDWGQLEEAFRRLEKAIASLPSITLLLSPMGERLLDGLEGLVQEGAPDNTDDIRQILSSEFFRRLDELEKEWERGFGFLSRIGSRLQGVVHGYDYFAFEEFGGPAFYQRPREWRRDLGVFVIDILNARLKIVLDRMEATNIYYLDLRNTLEPGDWTATLTPASTGFRKLAGAVSLFIGNQYKDDREPYPGTEYFLWQVALMEGILEFYIDLIEAYPKGKHRAWAEKRLMEAVKQKQDADFGEAVRPVPARRSWFLGIGINRYLHFQSLRNAVKDVQDIAALLQERYGLDVTDTTILLDEQATRKNIIAQLEEMVSKVGPEDKVLIYYSGHGHFNEKTGKGFWIPVDADAGSPAGYLPNVRIKDYMEVIPAYHTFLISDSLLSGSLFSEGKLRNTNEAIEDLDSNPSRWGLCSGRHDEEVYDGNPGENSPFAASILEVLRSNNEPALNVGKLIELVLKQARRHYRYLPEGNPFFDVGHEGGQYIFRLEGGAERPPDEQAQPQSQSSTSKAPSQQEPETLQSLQRRANELISSNQLGELFELLDKELEQGTDARERLAVYQKEYEQLEKQRRRSKRPNKQLDRDLASLADAVVELVEGLEPPPAHPKEGSSAGTEPLATVATETPNTEQPKTGSFTDPRDGRTYRTVELNGLRWMAENLNYDIRGGWFFENDPNTGRQYGRFYDWETAQRQLLQAGACQPMRSVPAW